MRDLDYALALAELCHFGRAAERCGVSQPGLSEQIRKLESVLGTPLFERARGGVTPTLRGQQLLRQIEVVVGQARKLLEMARTQVGALNGPVVLGVIPTLGPYYVPLVLRDLRREFPELELRLQESQTTVLLDALARFNLDVALVALPAEQDGLAASPLFFEPFQVLLPSGHPLSQSTMLDLSTLAADDLLLLDDGHCLRDQAISLCTRPKGQSPIGRAPRSASSLEMLRHMVAAGEGFSLMPALATREVSELNGLVRLRPLSRPDAGRTIGLVWRASDPRGSDFQRLAEVLRQSAPDVTVPVDGEGQPGIRPSVASALNPAA